MQMCAQSVCTVRLWYRSAHFEASLSIVAFAQCTCTSCCRSYHEFKAALGVMPAAEFEHHMCPEPHCSRVFPDLPRADWAKPEHRHAVCPHCKVGRRFKDRAGHPEASKRCCTQTFLQSMHVLSGRRLTNASRIGKNAL